MTLVIEFIRPDGTLLRHVDAGFEYLESADIPLANAERPIRVETGGNLFRPAIPLPDGLQTAVRIAATKLPLGGADSSIKVRLIVNGVSYELTLKVALQLTPIKEAANPAQPPIAPSTQPSVTMPPTPDPLDPQTLQCAHCGSDLVVKQITVGSRLNKFLACPRFPLCTYCRSLP